MVDPALAHSLRVDHATVHVVDALAEVGIHALLLKGPATCDLLGIEPGSRPHLDVDLLVSPGQLGPAGEVLASLGFRCDRRLEHRPPHLRPRHAEAWRRERDAVWVDLHRTMHGAELCLPSQVWEAAVSRTASIELLGRQIEVPSAAFRLVQLVMHAQDRDGPASKPWTDLRRALEVVPHSDWLRAVEIARGMRLDARMAMLLRRVDGGQEMAARLGLPSRVPLHLRLERRGARSSSMVVERLARAPWRDRPRLVVRALLPPRRDMRARDELAGAAPTTSFGAHARRWARATRSLVSTSRRRAR